MRGKKGGGGLRPAKCILMKFGTGNFFKENLTLSSFEYSQIEIPDVLNEDLRAFLLASVPRKYFLKFAANNLS
jgi:hypothetical protein